jgi:hypothetical protein
MKSHGYLANQFIDPTGSVPAKDRVGSDEPREIVQDLSIEPLPANSEAASLSIGQAQAAVSDLLAKHAYSIASCEHPEQRGEDGRSHGGEGRPRAPP